LRRYVLRTLNDIVVAAYDAYFQMPLQGLGFSGRETMIEPWVTMNFHHTYEHPYHSQTVDAQGALGLEQAFVCAG
jgi:hypothetical protein